MNRLLLYFTLKELLQVLTLLDRGSMTANSQFFFRVVTLQGNCLSCQPTRLTTSSVRNLPQNVKLSISFPEQRGKLSKPLLLT